MYIILSALLIGSAVLSHSNYMSVVSKCSLSWLDRGKMRKLLDIEASDSYDSNKFKMRRATPGLVCLSIEVSKKICLHMSECILLLLFTIIKLCVLLLLTCTRLCIPL